MALSDIVNNISESSQKKFKRENYDPLTEFFTLVFSRFPPVLAGDFKIFELERVIRYPGDVEYETRMSEKDGGYAKKFLENQKIFYELVKTIFLRKAIDRGWRAELSDEPPGMGWAVKIKKYKFSRGTEIMLNSGVEIDSAAFIMVGRFGRFSNTEIRAYLRDICNEYERIFGLYRNEVTLQPLQPQLQALSPSQ